MRTVWYLTAVREWMLAALTGRGAPFRQPRDPRPRAATGRVLAVCPGRRHVWCEAPSVPGGRVRRPILEG